MDVKTIDLTKLTDLELQQLGGQIATEQQRRLRASGHFLAPPEQKSGRTTDVTKRTETP